MSGDERLNKTAKTLGKTGEGFLKGGEAFHALQVIRNKQFIGLINQEFSKFSKLTKQTSKIGKTKTVRYDPHIKLTPSQMAAGNGVAKASQIMETVNKLLVPVVIAVDTCRIGYAGYKDYQNGTTRNIVETTVSVGGGWAGGYGGAMCGAAVGTAFLPGVGTIVGGIIGGLTGGITGSVASVIVVDKIGDAADYNIEIINCEYCGHEFKARKYKAEKYCVQCILEETLHIDDRVPVWDRFLKSCEGVLPMSSASFSSTWLCVRNLFNLKETHAN